MEAKIISKNKAVNVALSIISGLLLLLTLFFVAISLIFSAEKTAPNIFGSNIYIVRTSAFDLIEDSSALFVQSVPFEQITPGNIIIYSDSSYNAQIAEVREAKFGEGVFTYKIRLEDNTETYIGQSVIVGKAMTYSTFLGGLITFATSPFGLLLIVFIPCALLVALEVVKIARNKNEPSPKRALKKKVRIDENEEDYHIPVREIRKKNLEMVQDETEDEEDEAPEPPKPIQQPAPRVSERQVINAYTNNSSGPLFTPPAPKPKPTPKDDAPSSMRLENAIAKAKAERELTLKRLNEHKKIDEMDKNSKNIRLRHTLSIKSELTAEPEKPRQPVDTAFVQPAPQQKPHPRTPIISDVEPPKEESQAVKAPTEQNVKEFVPHTAPQAKEKRSSASLNKLFSDEKKSEKRYNIDDILKTLEKK